jgi:hypothetical protein
MYISLMLVVLTVKIDLLAVALHGCGNLREFGQTGISPLVGFFAEMKMDQEVPAIVQNPRIRSSTQSGSWKDGRGWTFFVL